MKNKPRIVVPSKDFRFFKSEAKRIKKESHVPHYQALEIVAKTHGFNNWREVSIANKPYNIIENAYKNGCLVVFDIKEASESILWGIDDDFIKHEELIFDVVEKELYQRFSDSTDEDDDQGRVMKDIYTEVELQEQFQELYHYNYSFFLIKNSENMSLEKLLVRLKEYSFWPPQFLWFKGKFTSTYYLPATDNDGKTLGIRM